MDKQGCILLSIAVAVPAVLSCCVPLQFQGIQGFAPGSVKEGKPSLTEVLCNYNQMRFLLIE